MNREVEPLPPPIVRETLSHPLAHRMTWYALAWALPDPHRVGDRLVLEGDLEDRVDVRKLDRFSEQQGRPVLQGD